MAVLAYFDFEQIVVTSFEYLRTQKEACEGRGRDQDSRRKGKRSEKKEKGEKKKKCLQLKCEVVKRRFVPKRRNVVECFSD